MGRIEVGRYKDPRATGFQGWAMPESGGKVPEWALFITLEGHVMLGVRDETGNLNFGARN